MSITATVHKADDSGVSVVTRGGERVGTITKVCDACYTATDANGVELGDEYGFGTWRAARNAVVAASVKV
jgi:hypothetical protein